MLTMDLGGIDSTPWDFYKMHSVLPVVHLVAEVQKFLHLDNRIKKDWVP